MRIIGNGWNSVLFIWYFFLSLLQNPEKCVLRELPLPHYITHDYVVAANGPYDCGHYGGCRTFHRRRLLKFFIAFFYIPIRIIIIFYACVCVTLTINSVRQWRNVIIHVLCTYVSDAYICIHKTHNNHCDSVFFFHLCHIIGKYVVSLTNRSPLVFRETKTISEEKKPLHYVTL